MPESPEVYTTRNDLSKLLEGEIISDIDIVGGRYLKHGYPEHWDLLTSLLPLTPTGVYCKGKMLWFEFKGTRLVLVSRFGMSGYYAHRELEASSPKHTAVEFLLLDSVFYYHDTRRFGSFKILPDGIGSELDRLGPCFLNCGNLVSKISGNDFADLIMTRPGHLARELMKQEVVSGIGNYILSECLYETRLNPLIMCNELTRSQAMMLYENIVEIIERGVKMGGVSVRDYQGVTNKGRAQNKLKVYGRSVDPEGNKVVIIKKGPHGRAIHWVPSLQ